MTKVRWMRNQSGIYGFSVAGHSSVDCDDEEGKLVCAAISSAVYLTANTATEIFGAKCEISENDASFVFKAQNPDAEIRKLLKGFQLHIEQLSEQYPKRIKILTEV